MFCFFFELFSVTKEPKMSSSDDDELFGDSGNESPPEADEDEDDDDFGNLVLNFHSL